MLEFLKYCKCGNWTLAGSMVWAVDSSSPGNSVRSIMHVSLFFVTCSPCAIIFPEAMKLPFLMNLSQDLWDGSRTDSFKFNTKPKFCRRWIAVSWWKIRSCTDFMTMLFRYIGSWMLMRRCKATGTFNNFVNVKGTSPSPKQKQRNS